MEKITKTLGFLLVFCLLLSRCAQSTTPSENTAAENADSGPAKTEKPAEQPKEAVKSRNGTYVNSENQKLTISNYKAGGGFDFDVKWGTQDEWDCMFTGKGNAQLQSESLAIYGENQDDYMIKFTLGEKTIQVEGGLDFSALHIGHSRHSLK